VLELRAAHAPAVDRVARTNSEWREHDATSESLEPEPKGEGTVWQRAHLNGSGQTERIQILMTYDEATPRKRARLCWAEIGSDDEPRFTLDVAGLFLGAGRSERDRHPTDAHRNEPIAAAHHNVRQCRALRGAAMSDVARLCKPATSRFDFPGTDLTVLVELNDGELSMTVNKADKSVYRVVLEQATQPIENAWLADMFMRNDRVQLGKLSADVDDYVETLNIAQG
jgi:hypothetical protein